MKYVALFLALSAAASVPSASVLEGPELQSATGPQVLYWPPNRGARPSPVGLLYTPEVLTRLASGAPGGVSDRIRRAIQADTPLVLLWAPPFAGDGPLTRPFFTYMFTPSSARDGGAEPAPSEDRILPVWVRQDADDLRKLDHRTAFREIGVTAAYPRSAFISGRIVVIGANLEPLRPDSKRKAQVYGLIEWNGSENREAVLRQ